MSHGGSEPQPQYDMINAKLHLFQLFDGTDEVGTGGEDLHSSGACTDTVDLRQGS